MKKSKKKIEEKLIEDAYSPEYDDNEADAIYDTDIDDDYEDENPDSDDDIEMLDIYADDTFTSFNDSNDDAEGHQSTDDGDDEESAEGISIVKILNTALLIAMLMILIVGVIKIYNWQKGKTLNITDDDLLENYDTESEDWYIYFDPHDDPDYVENDVKNIVILGDSLISDYTDSTSIQGIIEANTGASVTALGLSHTTVALHDKSYTLEHPEDAYSLYYIVASITGGDMGDYTLMSNSWAEMDDYGEEYNYWDVLHKIDFDSVDVLIICYNYDDFITGVPFVGDEVWSQQQYGTMDSYNGALDAALGMLKERFPHMQVIVSSPSFFMVDDNGTMVRGDLYNNGSGTLGEYVVNMKSVTMLRSTSFVDNYFGIDFNCDNYEDYLEDDMLHPNEAGRRMIADHITDFIYFMRSSDITVSD